MLPINRFAAIEPFPSLVRDFSDAEPEAITLANTIAAAYCGIDSFFFFSV